MVSHLDPELLALIALGEDPQDAGQHLALCAQCRSEADHLAAVVATARHGERRDEPGLSGPAALTQPPPELWDRIASAAGLESGASGGHLAAARPGPPPPLTDPARPDASPGPPGRARGRPRAAPWWRRHPLAAGLAGAVAGLIIGAAAAVGLHQLAAPPQARLVASIPLRPLPQFPRWHAARGTAVMRSGPGGRQLAVFLQAPRRPGYYEVWLLARDGVSMISLGDLGPGHTGRFAMPPGVNLANYSRIDVSLQPFDGSTLHAKTSVVRGSLP